MNFAFTEEQEQIRAAIAKICARFPDEYWLKKDKAAGKPARFEADTDVRDALKVRYEADKDAFVALLLGCQPWFKFDKEKEWEGFDLDAELAKLLKRATGITADAEKRTSKLTKIDPRKLAGLQHLVQMRATPSAPVDSGAPAAVMVETAAEASASVH